jgi:NAD(P)-dependent dehydrogenase (short-subunit alcohol dehydrogenase family)
MPKPRHFRDRVHGKVAIVTGAGAEKNEVGIGRAIALLLAAEGAAIVQAGDVTDPDDAERFVKTTIAVCGRLDIPINNFDIAGPITLADVTLAEWRRVMETS